MSLFLGSHLCFHEHILYTNPLTPVILELLNLSRNDSIIFPVDSPNGSTWIYVYILVKMHVSIYIYTHAYLYIYIYVYIYVYIYIYVYMYMYIYIYTHTYLYIYIYIYMKETYCKNRNHCQKSQSLVVIFFASKQHSSEWHRSEQHWLKPPMLSSPNKCFPHCWLNKPSPPQKKISYCWDHHPKYKFEPSGKQMNIELLK